MHYNSSRGNFLVPFWRLHYVRFVAKKNAATQVRLPPEIRDRLDAMASRSGFKISELIRRAIESFLNEIESEGEIRVPIGHSSAAVTSGAGYVLAEGVSSTSPKGTGSKDKVFLSVEYEQATRKKPDSVATGIARQKVPRSIPG